MKEIPILFSTPMVQAINELRKTQTRRIIKPQPDSVRSSVFVKSGFETCHGYEIKCPYGQSGDRLYIKEAIRKIEWSDGIDGIAYVADDEPVWDITRPCRWVWKNKTLPSMYMPKNIARTWLDNESVRVEKLQEISIGDIYREGCVPPWYNTGDDQMVLGKFFQPLWDSINARPKPIYKNKQIVAYESYPWDDIQEVREYRGKPWIVTGNPHVWVVGFKKVVD